MKKKGKSLLDTETPIILFTKRYGRFITEPFIVRSMFKMKVAHYPYISDSKGE